MEHDHRNHDHPSHGPRTDGPVGDAPVRDELRGRELHAALVLTIHRAAPRSLSVGELLSAVDALGFTVAAPRPTKKISDVLRADLARGYVVRTGRDRYVGGRVPRTTLWKMGDRLHRRLAGLPPRSY